VSEKAVLSRRRSLVALVGPTGSGKSALSIKLAEIFDAEIISCDALQVYRRLDIGTGKLNVGERSGIPHHLMDVVEPDQEFSAADYIRLAAPLIRDIDRRGKLPLVVGGTGLYLRSLRRGLFDGPGRAPELRARLSEIANRRGSSFMHRMLARVDPVSAARIHPNDLVRVVRALEVNLLSTGTMSDMMKRRRSPLAGYRFILIGIAPPRQELVRRIESRVEQMFASGFVDEVRRLIDEQGLEAPAFKAIGYREVGSYLAGELSWTEAQQRTVKATVQYAKRQMTWFRREEGIIWFAGGGEDPEVGRAVREHLETALGRITPTGEENSYAKAAS
jgi:tRNA dimethylallyltransferase